jgi:hypothetical protein
MVKEPKKISIQRFVPSERIEDSNEERGIKPICKVQDNDLLIV